MTVLTSIALNQGSEKPAIRRCRLQWAVRQKMVEDVREKVSFDDEPLILVDEDDNEVGYCSKGGCHEGHGTLHRAFSIFLFDNQADFGDRGAEHELCHVYIGVSGGVVRVHPVEIADWRWVPMEEVTRELEDAPSAYTPWFKLEWKALMDQWRNRINVLSEGAADT